MRDLNNNTENYYLKDTALVDKANDAFHHEDYVKNLKRIILEHEPPYNIALIGKWGVGKSSIINLLKEELKGKPEIVTHEINAWKYENDSLKKAFLKNLYRNFNPDTEASLFTVFAESLRKITGSVKQETKTLSPWQALKTIFPILSVLFVICLLSSIVVLLLLYAWDGIHAIFSSNSFSENAKDTYSIFKENIWIAIIIGPLYKILQDLVKSAIQRKHSEVHLIKPIETADEYEDLFKKEIEMYKTRYPQFKKLVVIVDDLDRLTTKKVVAALDAIKAFVEINECIFIVTCDDNILINALEKEKLNKSLDVDGELFLDKLFHFRISLPPIIERDMSEFAATITKQQAPSLVEACNGHFEEIIDILIHADVSTPRQVKKIMNTFANNILIARARESDGRKLEEKLLTNDRGLRYLAKLSVIQSDYNDVYGELIKDFSYFEDLLAFYQSGNFDDLDINPSVKKFFNYQNTNFQIKPHFEGLVNFLSRTQHITVDNVAPFIYLGQDIIGLNAGDEKQRMILQSLTSGNEKPILEMLNESNKKTYLIHAIIEVIKQASQKDIPSVIKASVPLINYITVDRREFANMISQRLNTVNLNQIRFWQVEPKDMLLVYRSADNKNGIEQGILTVLDELFTKSDNWKNIQGKEMSTEDFTNKITDILEMLFDVEEDLPLSVKTKMKKFLTDMNDEYNFYGFENIHGIYLNNQRLFSDYFGIPFYKQLVSDMEIAGEKQLAVEIQTFKELAPIIREQDSSIFIQSVPAVISSIDVNNVLRTLELLPPIMNNIDEDSASSIVEAVTYYTFEKEEADKVMKILQNLPLNLYFTDDLVERFDEFILKHLAKDNVDNLTELINLVEFAMNRNKVKFDVFIKVFEFVLENIFEKPENDVIFERLNKFFTEKQRTILFDKLKTPALFASYEAASFERVYVLYSNLIKYEENSPFIQVTMKRGIEEFRQNRWNQNINWANDFISLFSIVANIVDDEDMRSFISILEGPLTQHNRSEMAIMALRCIGKYVPEDKVTQLRTYSINNAITDTSKMDALDFLKSTRKHASNENGNLSEYAEFLVENFSLKVELFLSELDSNFSVISKDKVVKLISLAAGLNKEILNLKLPKIHHSIEKFYLGMDEKQREDILFELIKKEVDAVLLDNILLESLDSKNRTLLLNGSLASEAAKEKECRIVLLKLCSPSQNTIDKTRLIIMLADMLRENNDDDYIIQMCDILLDQYMDFRFYQEKRRISEQIIFAFRSVNISAKIKLLEVGKTFLLRDVFEGALKDDILSNEEAELVSKTFNIRKKIGVLRKIK